MSLPNRRTLHPQRRCEQGRLLAAFVACATLFSLVVLLAPLPAPDEVSPAAGRRLIEDSAPAAPLPIFAAGRPADTASAEIGDGAQPVR